MPAKGCRNRSVPVAELQRLARAGKIPREIMDLLCVSWNSVWRHWPDDVVEVRQSERYRKYLSRRCKSAVRLFGSAAVKMHERQRQLSMRQGWPPATRSQRQLLETVEQNPDYCVYQLRSLFGRGTRTTASVMRSLFDKGWVVKSGSRSFGWRWSLSPLVVEGRTRRHEVDDEHDAATVN